jgi:NAD-dependent histone deacetylase SIR2
MVSSAKRRKKMTTSSTGATQGLYADGKLFSEAAFRDTTERVQLLQKALYLRDLAVDCKPTLTHAWLASLGSQLLRLYTQNVDMLEDQAGLRTGLGQQSNCVQLHGTVASLECYLCHERYGWEDFRDDINLGRDLLCPKCTKRSKDRESAGKRRHTIGQLRPSMVMLDGPQPQGAEIAELVEDDCAADPQAFLILGTSLKVDGPKTLARQFARQVRACGGTVIYVNRSKPTSAWDNLIDYWVEWTCDAWVGDLLRRQGTLQSKTDKTGSAAPCRLGSYKEYPIVVN